MGSGHSGGEEGGRIEENPESIMANPGARYRFHKGGILCHSGKTFLAMTDRCGFNSSRESMSKKFKNFMKTEEVSMADSGSLKESLEGLLIAEFTKKEKSQGLKMFLSIYFYLKLYNLIGNQFNE